MSDLTFDVIMEYSSSKSDYGEYNIGSYYRKECYNSVNEENLNKIIIDQIDLIIESNNIVEPNEKNVSILNLYNNEPNIFPRILQYYKDRYKKYTQFLLDFDLMKCGKINEITIDLNECYDFCLDDEVHKRKSKNVHEIITIRCF